MPEYRTAYRSGSTRYRPRSRRRRRRRNSHYGVLVVILLVLLLLVVLLIRGVVGLFSLFTTSGGSKNEVVLQIYNPRAFCNGAISELEGAPYLDNSGAAAIPVKSLELLGANVEWDAANKTAIITVKKNTVRVQTGSRTLRLNDETQQMTSEPTETNNVVFIPAQDVCAALQWQVHLLEEKDGQLVIVSKSKKEMSDKNIQKAATTALTKLGPSRNQLIDGCIIMRVNSDKIYCNGQTTQLSSGDSQLGNTVLNHDGTIMIPLKAAIQTLGGTVARDGDNAWSITCMDIESTINAKGKARANGKSIKGDGVSTYVDESNSTYYVSAQMFAGLIGRYYSVLPTPSTPPVSAPASGSSGGTGQSDSAGSSNGNDSSGDTNSSNGNGSSDDSGDSGNSDNANNTEGSSGSNSSDTSSSAGGATNAGGTAGAAGSTASSGSTAIAFTKMALDGFDSQKEYLSTLQSGLTQAVTGTVPQADVYVALTFDDGPTGATNTYPDGYTATLLNELKKRNVHATFFMCGYRIKDFNSHMKRYLEEGHELGNHTMDHPDSRLTALSAEEVYEQVDSNSALIESYTGARPTVMRPVGGGVNSTVKEQMAQLGLPIINWSVDTLDWETRTDPDSVKQKIIDQVKDGSIVLMHDLWAGTLPGVLAAIDELQSRTDKTYAFVTVSELAAIHGIVLEPGVVYNELSDDTAQAIKNGSYAPTEFT